MRKRMGYKLLCCILTLALVFPLGGCGKQKPGTDGNGAGTKSDGTGMEGAGLSGEDLFLSLEDLPWKDNSLDAYSAVLNLPLQSAEPKDSGFISNNYVLGNSRASVFANHYFEAEDTWGEVITVTDRGEETSQRVTFRNEKTFYIREGTIAGSDHYIMMGIEKDESQGYLYRFFETDEALQVLNSFYVDFLDKTNPEYMVQFQRDAQGNLHMITNRQSEETYHYYVVAPDGTLLASVGSEEGYEYTWGQPPKLFLLYDGRVGMQFEEQMHCVDVGTGKPEVLARIKEDSLYCTLWDEKTLLYADSTGIYRSSLSGEDPELLYEWRNHGVLVSAIDTMQVTEGGEIGLIYQDYWGGNYLKLKPTTEEVEIIEIDFAVSSYQNSKFRSAIAAFNKKHPAYRIRTQMYGAGESRLLTELIAGEGPVLVDTLLTGFEDKTDWWEPLDGVFQQMLLDGELIPRVMDIGRIDGTLYGIVGDFTLSTVATFAEEPDEWDYDAFLSCFDENNPSIKAPFTPIFGGCDGWTFTSVFFLHGLKEKYLYDAENCTTRIDSEEFRKILRLGRSFMDDKRQPNCEDLRQGTSLCAVVYINGLRDLACLRIWSGNKIRFIGYPSEEGGKHYVEGHPIAVRVNASAEERRLAHSFLKFLLSYDAQMEAAEDTNLNYNMSVRKDVLEEQEKCLTEISQPSLIGFPQFAFGDQVDNDLDMATLYGLLEQAEPKRGIPGELLKIFMEEMRRYLSGELTEDVLIEHLENRVGLYLSEQK